MTDAFGRAASAVLLSCLVAVAIYVLIDRPLDRYRVKITEASLPA